MMDIEKRIETVKTDHEALLRRRQQLLSQAERIRDEIVRINEEIMRCQGAFTILEELRKEEPVAPATGGCPAGIATEGEEK